MDYSRFSDSSIVTTSHNQKRFTNNAAQNEEAKINPLNTSSSQRIYQQPAIKLTSAQINLKTQSKIVANPQTNNILSNLNNNSTNTNTSQIHSSRSVMSSNIPNQHKGLEMISSKQFVQKIANNIGGSKIVEQQSVRQDQGKHISNNSSFKNSQIGFQISSANSQSQIMVQNHISKTTRVQKKTNALGLESHISFAEGGLSSNNAHLTSQQNLIESNQSPMSSAPFCGIVAAQQQKKPKSTRMQDMQMSKGSRVSEAAAYSSQLSKHSSSIANTNNGMSLITKKATKHSENAQNVQVSKANLSKQSSQHGSQQNTNRLIVQKSSSQKSMNQDSTTSQHQSSLRSFRNNTKQVAAQYNNNTASKTIQDSGNQLVVSLGGSGSQSQNSLFSQGQNAHVNNALGIPIQNSNKKSLMPSGSSGALFKKQIVLEQDEANSSSSSSIGKEEYANQALNGAPQDHKLKNQLFKFEGNSAERQQESKSRLNFTGRPFAPENIFQIALNNEDSLEQQRKNDIDESIIDQYAIKLPSSGQQVENQFGDIINQNEQFTQRNNNLVKNDTNLEGIMHDDTTKDLFKAQQELKGLKTLKGTIITNLGTKKINVAPPTSQTGTMQTSPDIAKAKQHQVMKEEVIKSRLSIGEQSQSNKLLQIGTNAGGAGGGAPPSLKIKIQKTTIVASNKNAQDQKQNDSEREKLNEGKLSQFENQNQTFGDLVKKEHDSKNQQQTNQHHPTKNFINKPRNSLLGENRIKLVRPGGIINYEKYEKPQMSPRVQQKLGENQLDQSIMYGVNRTSELIHERSSSILTKMEVTNELRTSSDRPNMMKSAIKSQNPNIVQQSIQKAEQFELSINPFNNSLDQTKKIMTQDLKGISQLSLKTPKKFDVPKKQEHQIPNQKLTINPLSRQQVSIQFPKHLSTSESHDRVNLLKSTQELERARVQNNMTSQINPQNLLMKKQQQNKLYAIDPSSICRIDDLEEKLSSPKSIQSQLQMTLKSQSQKFQMIKGLVSKKSKFEKQLDEFNSLAIEDDVNEERDKSEEIIRVSHVQRPVQTSQKLQVDNKNRQNANKSTQIIYQNQQSALKQQSSPSISNKIPSSLAFRIKSHENQSQDEENYSVMGDSMSPSKKIRLFKGDIASLGNTKQIFEDDQNPLSTRRLGNAGELTNFSLQNKDELNRNIPFTKFRNMDFSGIASFKVNSPSKVLSKISIKCPQLILKVDSLRTTSTYFDFDTLMKVMSLTKQLREGFTNKPSDYQLEIAKLFKKQMRQLLILGLTSTIQRIQFWNFRTKFYYGKKKKPNLYRTLKRLKTNENAAAEIRKDVHRTFPDISYFQEPQKGQKKLFNILNALAQKNVKTGYIQGMNFLAGTILLNLQKGEETFWMMMSILQKFEFDSILDLRNGGRFQVLCFQLEVLMQKYLPKLEEHLKHLRIPTDIYAANWFITMFCYELSLDLVFCILDVFLLEGIKSLLRISLALLKCMEPQLLQMSYDECMVYLSHCQKDLEIDSQTLLKEAYQFKITNSLLQELENFYSLRQIKLEINGKETQESIKTSLFLKTFNRIQLEENENMPKKFYWMVLPATPEDMSEVIKRCKSKKINIDVTEEEILIFYQNYLKQKSLSEIVQIFKGSANSLSNHNQEDQKLFNIDDTVEITHGPQFQKNNIIDGALTTASRKRKEEKNLPKFIQTTAQKKNRRKALSTVFNDQMDPGTDIKMKLINHLESINTIQELSNDEYSRGGYSSQVKKSPIKNFSNGKSRHSNLEKESFSQKTSQIDYRSIQMNKSHLPPTHHQHSNETPQATFKGEINFNKESMRDRMVIKSSESPFQQLGSRIKNLFGNFFKVDEKINKSYEDINNGAHEDDTFKSYRGNGKYQIKEDIKRNSRSKSIFQAMMPSSDELGEILIIDKFDGNEYKTNQRRESFNERDSTHKVNNPVISSGFNHIRNDSKYSNAQQQQPYLNETAKISTYMNLTNRMHDSSSVPPRPQPPTSVRKQKLPSTIHHFKQQHQNSYQDKVVSKKKQEKIQNYQQNLVIDDLNRKRSEDYQDEDDKTSIKFGRGIINMALIEDFNVEESGETYYQMNKVGWAGRKAESPDIMIHKRNLFGDNLNYQPKNLNQKPVNNKLELDNDKESYHRNQTPTSTLQKLLNHTPLQQQANQKYKNLYDFKEQEDDDCEVEKLSSEEGNSSANMDDVPDDFESASNNQNRNRASGIIGQQRSTSGFGIASSNILVSRRRA